MITIDRIKAAEAENKAVRTVLADIGERIYAIREGHPMNSGYLFHSYSLTTYQGDSYYGQDGPDWGKDTPIVSLRYYCSSYEDDGWVTFPQAWLTEDFVQLEFDRVAAEKAAAEAEAAAIETARIAIQEEADRQTYERLKKRYEEPKSC